MSNCSVPSSLALSNDTNHTTEDEGGIPTPPSIPQPLSLSFKLVGDNLDKSVRPRHETVDQHLKSLHFFHMYAVRDRFDSSSLADDPALCDVENCDVTAILPSLEDDTVLRSHASVLAARIIRKRFKFFSENVIPVTRHIKHKYSKEMSKKSEVVSYQYVIRFLYSIFRYRFL